MFFQYFTILKCTISFPSLFPIYSWVTPGLLDRWRPEPSVLVPHLQLLNYLGDFSSNTQMKENKWINGGFCSDGRIRYKCKSLVDPSSSKIYFLFLLCIMYLETLHLPLKFSGDCSLLWVSLQETQLSKWEDLVWPGRKLSPMPVNHTNMICISSWPGASSCFIMRNLLKRCCVCLRSPS